MAATFIITFKVAEGTDSTFVTSTKRAELAKDDALKQFRAIDRFKDVEIEGMEAVGDFEDAAIATHSAEVIARIKQDHYPELFKKVLEMRNAQMDELVKWASHQESSFFGLRTIRTKRDLDKATERRKIAECEVDDFIKEHKEEFK